MRPVDVTPHILAVAKGISEPCLWWLAFNVAQGYKATRSIQVKGKNREVDPPTPPLKRLFRRLHRFIQKELRPHRVVHGGAKGRSCVTAANVHKGSPFIVTRDIQKCYPSISTNMLRRRLLHQGFRSDTAKLLSLLLTHRDIIPHGSPASCDALNLFLGGADRALAGKCRRHGGRYTRTYDDMVVSTGSRPGARTFATALEEQIERHELQVSDHKRRDHGFQPAHELQRVHNLVVNNGRGVGMTDKQYREALAVGETYVRSARCVSPDSLEALAYRRSQVHGWLHFSRQLRFSPAKHLQRLLTQGDGLVRRRLERERVARTGKWWVRSRKRNRPRMLADKWRQIRQTTAQTG